MTKTEPQYVVRQGSSGAWYVIDQKTAQRVYGTFRETDARARCAELNQR